VPGKAAYLALENDPDLEFEFYLARQIGGMTVAEMRQRMGNDEYVLWTRFFMRKQQAEELANLRAGG
jgi:hypothetical protein